MPGFAQQNRLSKLRVINPGSDSLEVESLSSALAPPPCYSSYKEGTTTVATVCIEDRMRHPPNEDNVDTFQSDSRSAAAYPEPAPPSPWLEENPPSPYSFEDLPKIAQLPEIYDYLGPAAPSSTYTQSCGLGVSRSQSRDMRVTSWYNHTTNSTSEPYSPFPPVHARIPVGHSSTPNISSLYHQGSSQSQALYRHIPVSQPLIGRPYLPNVINTDADGEATASQDDQIPMSDGNYSSALCRGLPSTSKSAPFGHVEQRLPTNSVSLSRRCTYKCRTFPLLPSRRKTNSSSIMGIFVIDPHLRLPAGLLKIVDSSCPPLVEHSAPLEPRRKNLVLETEDGGIEVDIQIIPSKVPRRIDATLYPASLPQSRMPQQPQTRRSTDKRYLQPGSVENQTLRQSPSQLVVSEGAAADALTPTRLDLRLKEGHLHCTSEKFQLIARINAPSPRPPIHLVASTIDHAPSADPITGPNPKRTQSRRLQSRSHARPGPPRNEPNKSPVILHLPHNFHGPLTVCITAGNIDAHVRLSKELSRVAVILSENSASRGYFISSSGLTEFGGRPRIDEELEVVIEGEDGWVMVEQMEQTHGVGNNRQPLSMPRGGDPIESDEEWYGDKVGVFVGDGKVYLQFLDEPDPFGRQKGFWQKLATGLGCR